MNHTNNNADDGEVRTEVQARVSRVTSVVVAAPDSTLVSFYEFIASFLQFIAKSFVGASVLNHWIVIIRLLPNSRTPVCITLTNTQVFVFVQPQSSCYKAAHGPRSGSKKSCYLLASNEKKKDNLRNLSSFHFGLDAFLSMGAHAFVDVWELVSQQFPGIHFYSQLGGEGRGSVRGVKVTPFCNWVWFIQETIFPINMGDFEGF